ncbi:MAG: phosphomannomutase/phosphoglucomutase [Aquiluna sp.]|nr:phosphomannomutase/phosphoglucomutase [Aquiluna sp.]
MRSVNLINFDAFVKTYDVRGLVDVELSEEIIEAFGAGFADELDLQGKALVVGHDMRDSSPRFAAAFAKGATLRGADVRLIGLCSTDMTYFASGKYELPAAMFTASHNPASYNGIKFSRELARGISMDTGLANIRDRAKAFLEAGIQPVSRQGTVTALDVRADYANYMHELVNLQNIRPLRIVVDAANGMGGYTVPLVLQNKGLPIEVVEMYFELDGSFPNHEANPLDPKNLVDLQARVLAENADLGLAFDGDADRCFAVDEKGELVSPSALAAIVSKREIERVKALGEEEIVVLHNLLTSRSVEEVILASGAKPVRTKVGHSLIKDQMADTRAVFGGEHSAHYYFRDFWGADNGMLAALHLISELGTNSEPMSQLSARYTPYFSSGEINSTIEDRGAAIARLRAAFPDAVVEEFDGFTFSSSSENWWWFNVRPSNTEPLLRLNAESNHEALLVEIRDKAIKAIRNS